VVENVAGFTGDEEGLPLLEATRKAIIDLGRHHCGRCLDLVFFAGVFCR
jgi:hypothetical protein